jgi:sugar lactone lactonase YvrE
MSFSILSNGRFRFWCLVWGGWFVGVVLVCCGYDDYLGIGRSPGFRDGSRDTARLFFPYGMKRDPLGNLFFADFGNHKVRVYHKATDQIQTIGKNSQTLHGPIDVAVWYRPERLPKPAEHWVFVTDTGNHRIQRIRTQGSQLVFQEELSLAGTGSPGWMDGPAESAQFRNPSALAVYTPPLGDPRIKGQNTSEDPPMVFVSDTQNHILRSITYLRNQPCQKPLTEGQSITGYCVHTIAGNQRCHQVEEPIRHTEECLEYLEDEPPNQWLPASQAAFHQPGGLAVDKCGHLYVSDTHNHRIRKIRYVCTPQSPDPFAASCYQVKTIAGSAENRPTASPSSNAEGKQERIPLKGHQDGDGLQARFAFPQGITVTDDGVLYVADFNNHLIRQIAPQSPFSCDSDPSYTVRTIRWDRPLQKPFAIAFSLDNKEMYVTVTFSERHMIYTINDYTRFLP